MKKIKKKTKKVKSFGRTGVYGSSGFELFSTNLSGCGKLKLSLDDIYRFKKINTDVANCINIIANKISLNGLLLQDDKGEFLDKDKYRNEYEYLDKLFSSQTFRFWKDQLITQTTLSGENYLEPVYQLNGKINNFAVLDSRGMSKMIDDKGNITGFKQYILGRQKQEFTRDEIGYFMFRQDVDNENLSLGVLDTIIYDIIADFEASKTNFSFFKNNAIPNALFLLDNDLPSDQIQKASEQIKKQFAGSDNQHKHLIAGGIKDVKTLNISHKDMDFINQRLFTTTKITVAFGVPKELIGYVTDSGSYSKVKEIRKEFHQNTIYGYERYLENIANSLINKYKKDLLIDLTKYKIKCNIQSFEDRHFLEDSQRKDLRHGLLTIDEIRTLRGLKPYNNKLSKSSFLDSSLIPMELVGKINNNT